MKVGLIGCGRVAGIHMKSYKALKNVDVLAVSDTDLNRAKKFAEPYKIDKVLTDYNDLLEIPDLDFVDVCTPTSTHETIVTGAAKAGINVLMEKPMGRNSPECERMIEASRKHGIQLCVCHNQLFFPHVQRLKAIANSENYQLTSFRTSHRENFEWLRGHNLAQPWNVNPEHGGILWEVGTHLAYLQLSFLNDINEVYALGVKSKYSVWDDFVVLLKTSSYRWGIMEISWVALETEIVYEISNSTGQRVQTYLPHGYIIDMNQEKASTIAGAARNMFSDQGRLWKKWSKFLADQVEKPQLGHFALLKSYVGSLQNGSSPPVTGEDGRNAIKLLECIEKSLNEGTPVKFSSW